MLCHWFYRSVLWGMSPFVRAVSNARRNDVCGVVTRQMGLIFVAFCVVI